MSDLVKHPSHYSKYKIEVLSAIEEWGLGFHLGNVVKYCVRAGRKLPEGTVHIQKKLAIEIQDLEKAKFYLERRIEILKAEKEERSPKAPNQMDSRFISPSVCTNMKES